MKFNELKKNNGEAKIMNYLQYDDLGFIENDALWWDIILKI